MSEPLADDTQYREIAVAEVASACEAAAKIVQSWHRRLQLEAVSMACREIADEFDNPGPPLKPGPTMSVAKEGRA